MELLDDMNKLTAREIEVLKFVANGYSNTQTGRLLGISHRTVDTHRTNIRNKLGVGNLAGMIKYALKAKLID